MYRHATVLIVTALGLAACSSGGSDAQAPANTPASATTGATTTATSQSSPDPVTRQAFTKLERGHEARLGVEAIDTADGRTVQYRSRERFAYASTIKTFSAGAVLDAIPASGLDTVVHYARRDLVDYSPITEKHVKSGMTLREVGAAAIRYSDNTAGNLLMQQVGGPAGVQKALRATGDQVTMVARTEPTLNEAVPGDPRDTSSPQTLATDLRAFVLGDALAADDRAVLTGWLRTNTTGDALIRAAVPKGWAVGDKSGSASYGTRNDIAVIWPPGRAPIVLVVLTSHDSKDATTDDGLVAQAAGVVIAALR